MINLPLSSAPCQNIRLDIPSSDTSVSSTNQQEAAFSSIATRGHWNSQYMDLVVPSLPKLAIWPIGRGLVIVEGGMANHHDASGSRSINISDIDLNNDVVLKRINNNHYNLLLPSGEKTMAEDGECLFRAVVTGLNRSNLESSVTSEYIQELRMHVAKYVFESWETLKDFVMQEDTKLESSPYEELNYLSSRFISLQGSPEVDKSTHLYSSVSKITPPPLPKSAIPQHEATTVKSEASLASSQNAVQPLAGNPSPEALNSRQLNLSKELLAIFEYRALQAGLESHRLNKLNENLPDDGEIYENDGWPEVTSIASQDELSNLSTPTSVVLQTTRAVGQFKSESGAVVGKSSVVTMLITQLNAMLAPALDAIRGTKPFNVKEMDGLAKILRMINRSMTEAPPSEKAVWIERGLTELFTPRPGNQLSKAESILKHRDVPALQPVAFELMIFMQDAADKFMGDGKDSAISWISSPAVKTSSAVEFRALFERLQDEYGMAF